MKNFNWEIYDLHNKAGLIDSGLDEQGETEWLGTDREWKKFEKLYNKFLKK